MFLLQFIGGIVVFVLIVILMGYLFFRIKFGKFLHSGIESEPMILHLTEDLAPSWLEKPEVKNTVAALEGLGFEKGVTYTIYEKPEYLLLSFFKSGTVAAVVYWHDIAGCWIDLVADEEEGLEYTVSNAPYGSEMKSRPECRKYYLKGESPGALVSKLEGVLESLGKQLKPISTDTFRDAFEGAYKKDMAWKHRNGGLSYEEFLSSVDKDSSFKVKDKHKEEAFIEMKQRELDNWREAALEEYRKSEGIKQEDFYELDSTLLVVPFTTDARAFLRYLNDWEFVSDSNLEPYSERFKGDGDIYNVFETINSCLSPDLRAEYLTNVDFPLDQKIYKISSKMAYD